MRLPIVFLLLVVMLTGSLSAQDEEFHVFASHSILADVVARVAGDALQVRSLLPAGADPHAYSLSAREVVELLEADLLFVNGVLLEEGALRQILEAEATLPTVGVSDCVALWHVLHDEEFEHADHGHHEEDDMHDEDHEHEEESDHHDEDEMHDEDHEHEEESDHHDEDEMDDEDHEQDEDSEHHDDSDVDEADHEHEEDSDHHDEDEHGEEGDHDENTLEGAIAACQELRSELGLPAVPSNALVVANACDQTGHEHEHEEEQNGSEEKVSSCDPHVWHDPHNAMLWTVNIRDTLSEHVPEHAEAFAANAEAYLEELRELDAHLSERLQELPEPRLLVTLHEIFGYFATRYGFEQDSVLRNFSSLAEANPAELAELLDHLREQGVRALFGEEPLQDSVLEQLANELGVPLVAVYGDTLSESDGPAATYIEYMRENIRRISEAFVAGGG